MRSPHAAHRLDTHHTNHHTHMPTHIENTDDKLMNQLVTEFEAVGGKTDARASDIVALKGSKLGVKAKPYIQK